VRQMASNSPPLLLVELTAVVTMLMPIVTGITMMMPFVAGISMVVPFMPRTPRVRIERIVAWRRLVHTNNRWIGHG
jgi:hypothetical protein